MPFPNAVRVHRRRKNSRRGFTLLELLLALALAVAVIAMVVLSMRSHMHQLNSGRTEVEEAQLARTVLKQISDDLRGAIYYEPPQSPQLAGAGGQTGDTDTGNTTDGNAGSDQGGGSDQAAGASASDADLLDTDLDDAVEGQPASIADTASVMTRPGLYGNQYELQIEVGRLPRVDQYQALAASSFSGELTDIPSDVKSVAYYVRQQASLYATRAGESPLDGSRQSFVEYGQGTGLVRRELDYSVAQWAASEGTQQQVLDQSGRLIAPEIVHLEFRYFDGLQWLMEWNSEAMGGLPKAVEIVLVVASQRKGAAEQTSATSITDRIADMPKGIIYRKVVFLPTAAAPTVNQEEEDLLELGL